MNVVKRDFMHFVNLKMIEHNFDPSLSIFRNDKLQVALAQSQFDAMRCICGDKVIFAIIRLIIDR